MDNSFSILVLCLSIWEYRYFKKDTLVTGTQLMAVHYEDPILSLEQDPKIVRSDGLQIMNFNLNVVGLPFKPLWVARLRFHIYLADFVIDDLEWLYPVDDSFLYNLKTYYL